MGKKPNSKAQKNKKSGTGNFWIIGGAAAVMIVIVWFTFRSVNPGSSDESGNTPSLIATLAPEKYSGRIRMAYQAAKDIPEILVQLPCFCGCKDSLGHRNNLYCFADGHGSICDECQEIALTAKEMHAQGKSISEIRDKIVSTYATTQ